MAGKTNFGKITLELQRQQERGSGNVPKFEKINWMKIPYGDTVFMVCPPFDDESNIYEEVYLHFGFADSEGNQRSYKCSKSKHKKCPICDRVAELEKAGNLEAAKDIKAKHFYLYNVVDMEMNNRVVASKPSMNKELMLELNSVYTEENVDVTDLNNGRQIKLVRLKKDPWARARAIAKAVPMTPEVVEKLENGIRDLKKIYIDNSPEELARMMNGEDINKKDPNKKEAKVEEIDEAVQGEVTPEESQEIIDAAPTPVKTVTRTTAIPVSAPVVKAKTVATPVAVAPKTATKAVAPVMSAKSAPTEEVDAELAELESILNG